MEYKVEHKIPGWLHLTHVIFRRCFYYAFLCFGKSLVEIGFNNNTAGAEKKFLTKLNKFKFFAKS